ncbi:unnamed protein product [Echinostoma caproni]|uniref:CDI domain-containing protein n=1 Tax=Echinostoma caproni TaxID=27848 RepID=A0A183AA91_9TREM|nr:unnamed protein product [Echinostoma caproni]
MFPRRCLFACAADKSTVAPAVSGAKSGPTEELKRACRKSVAHFRRIYQFDLELSRPTVDSCELKRTTSMGQFGSNRESDSRVPNVWHWESVDLRTTYVPEFYHPEQAKLPGYQREVLSKSVSAPVIPRTPHKVINRLPARVKSKQGVATDATPSTSPTLFTLWRPKIRRSTQSMGSISTKFETDERKARITLGLAGPDRNGPDREIQLNRRARSQEFTKTPASISHIKTDNFVIDQTCSKPRLSKSGVKSCTARVVTVESKSVSYKAAYYFFIT